MKTEDLDVLDRLAKLFGPAGAVLVVVCAGLAWWIWKTHGWHRDERLAWELAAKAEREAWAKRMDGFRQDIKDAFANVNGVSKDMAEALGKVVDVVTDLRVTVAGKGFK